ncbi:3-oxoacyl-[acyl-carrier-protein] reductase FabG-like protein, partial [Drosera capensis]
MADHVSPHLEPWRVLDNQVVMVTGASSGIGREFCLDLARAGCRIIPAARRTDRLKSLCDEINGLDSKGVRAVAVELDVSTEGDVIERAVGTAWDSFGRIDVLINNAGVRGNVRSPLELSQDEWDSTFKTNLRGAWLVSKYVSIRMRDATIEGCIINISSIGGINRGHLPGGLAYNASKAAVNTMTKVMALELGPYKIRVNCIAPGLFRSEITEKLLEKDWLEDVHHKIIPLKNTGTVDPALTSLIRYLIHESSGYVTGNIFIIDAGSTLPVRMLLVFRVSLNDKDMFGLSPHPPLPHLTSPSTRAHSTGTHSERGIPFTPGGAFYRPESAIARDLAALAASLQKHHHTPLRILDAMCGSGIRSLRYLVHADADFVHSNDANEEDRGTVIENLSRVVERWRGGERRWVVTSEDANRVLSEAYLRRDWFDLIDLDCFGSESGFLRAAFNAVRIGGLVYVTSTDGFSSGGHRPERALAAYGAYVRAMPFANEIGLRMLVGGAVREASVLEYKVRPLFSYYSYHRPVFRVMLRVGRGKGIDMRVGTMVSSATVRTVGIRERSLGRSSGESDKPGFPVVSGPLWTGPLHDAAYISDMYDLAKQWGWIGEDVGQDMDKLLKLMIDESDPELPPGFIEVSEVTSRGKIDSPPLRTLIDALRKIWNSSSVGRGSQLSKIHTYETLLDPEWT